MQSNNSIMNSNIQMSQQHLNHHQQLQQQLQQHLNNQHGYMNGMSGSGVGGSGNVGNNHMLSELPEPPISVSEIGPIPPPPMFSSPSPTMVAGRPHGPGIHGMSHDYDYDGKKMTRSFCFSRRKRRFLRARVTRNVRRFRRWPRRTGFGRGILLEPSQHWHITRRRDPGERTQI